MAAKYLIDADWLSRHDGLLEALTEKLARIEQLLTPPEVQPWQIRRHAAELARHLVIDARAILLEAQKPWSD